MLSCSPEIYWSIYPPSLDKMLGEFRSHMREVSFKVEGDNVQPASGPVADLEQAGYPVEVRDQTAVIPILGPIEKRGSFFLMLFGGTSIQFVQRALWAAVADKDVKRILLRIDSPGGSVNGLSELGDTLNDVKAKKPVFAYIEGMGCSAAYYIASYAEQIYAERTALIGSIGTIMALYDWSAWAAKEGIKPVVIATGEYKGAGIVGTEVTEAHKAEFQKIVDFYFGDFMNAVARGRGMTKAQLKEYADGRIWGAPEAKTIGLSDGVKRLDDLFAGWRSRKRSVRAAVEMIDRVWLN